MVTSWKKRGKQIIHFKLFFPSQLMLRLPGANTETNPEGKERKESEEKGCSSPPSWVQNSAITRAPIRIQSGGDRQRLRRSGEQMATRKTEGVAEAWEGRGRKRGGRVRCSSALPFFPTYSILLPLPLTPSASQFSSEILSIFQYFLLLQSSI